LRLKTIIFKNLDDAVSASAALYWRIHLQQKVGSPLHRRIGRAPHARNGVGDNLLRLFLCEDALSLEGIYEIVPRAKADAP
jgi:hypothetical protein